VSDLVTPSEDLLRQLMEAARQVPILQARIKQLELRTDNSPQYHVHNDSGEEIPAYACMQVTGTEELYEQTYLTVDKPADVDGTAGWFVFNGPNPIATGDEGTIQKGPIFRGFKNSGTVTAGDIWGPTSGQWYLSADGSLCRVFGDDNVDDDVFRFTMTGGAQVKLFKTPGGGIGAASGDGSGGSPYVWGSATCTEIDSSGVLTANTYTVKNIVTDTIGGNVAIKAILVGSDWIVDVASCPP
jgi:hypothetical protein